MKILDVPLEIGDALTIDLDPILDQIGSFGKFQVLELILVILVNAGHLFPAVDFMFTGYVPKHRCLIPQCENASNVSYYKNESDHAFPDYVFEGQNKGMCERPGVTTALVQFFFLFISIFWIKSMTPLFLLFFINSPTSAFALFPELRRT